MFRAVILLKEDYMTLNERSTHHLSFGNRSCNLCPTELHFPLERSCPRLYPESIIGSVTTIASLHITGQEKHPVGMELPRETKQSVSTLQEVK